MANSATNEALLRELLAGHAGLAAEVKGLSGRVDGVDKAAREARDAARDSAAATRAQDIPAEMEKLRGQVAMIASDGRSDLVNAVTKVTEEMRKGLSDHDGRIKRLEDARSRFDGATGLLGWLSRNAPWLLTALAAAAAFFGLRDHHV